MPRRKGRYNKRVVNLGEYFKTAEQMYECFGTLFKRASADPQIGKRLAQAGIVVRFEYTDPEGAITIDLKNKPREEGAYATIYLGECPLAPDVVMKQSADFSHRFWHGKENAVMAIATRKISASGDVGKALGLLPAISPLFRLYPKVLAELGHPELVLK
ncbi:MAG: SCP2 sterol-binding domain-containing protein [Candidatus Bipolaricaulia bacterium]